MISTLVNLKKVALSVIFIGLIACAKDENPTLKEEISASVSSVGAFTSSNDFDTVFGVKVVTGTGTILTMQGTDNSGRGFLLRISSYTGPGTYELGANAFDLAVWINGPSVGDQFSTGFSGTSGSILVSADEERVINGTFAFTAKQSDNSAIRTITDGKFKVNFR